MHWRASRVAFGVGDRVRALTTSNASTGARIQRPFPSDLTGFTDIAAGYYFNCALGDGKPTCWGQKMYSQTTPPDDVVLSSIEAGYWHICGVTTANTLACWGLTTGNTPAGKFKAVSAGIEHTCAIREDGTATCWGKADDGRTAAPDGKFLAISAGGGHSCGLLEDFSVLC